MASCVCFAVLALCSPFFCFCASLFFVLVVVFYLFTMLSNMCVEVDSERKCAQTYPHTFRVRETMVHKIVADGRTYTVLAYLCVCLCWFREFQFFAIKMHETLCMCVFFCTQRRIVSLQISSFFLCYLVRRLSWNSLYLCTVGFHFRCTTAIFIYIRSRFFLQPICKFFMHKILIMEYRATENEREYEKHFESIICRRVHLIEIQIVQIENDSTNNNCIERER